MFRSLLAASAVFVLLFSALVLPPGAAACEAELPETLLSLYKNSSEIHVAVFDKTEDVSIAEEGADYRMVNIKKHFTISSTLVGESRKFFVLEDQEYRYTGKAENDSPADGPEEDYGLVQLKSGDDLLLFLKTGEEGKIVLTHYRDGTKRMPKEFMSSYEARINELKSIIKPGKDNDAAIVDWLIRCIEDPVTRWEGAFELLQSAQNLEWKEEAAREEAQRVAGGEKGEAAETVSGETIAAAEAADGEKAEEVVEEHSEPDNAKYIRLVSDAQKHRLTGILLDQPIKNDAEKKADEMIESGNRALAELVQRWGDGRLPAYLLERLAVSDDAYMNTEMMRTIARILDDNSIKKIFERYSEVAYEDGEAAVNSAQAVDTFDGTKDALTSEGDGNAVETTRPSEHDRAARAAADDSAKKDGAENARRQTYKELRDKLMSEFLSRGAELIAANKAKTGEIAAATSN